MGTPNRKRKPPVVVILKRGRKPSGKTNVAQVKYDAERYYTWTTGDERRYIQALVLGTYSPLGRTPSPPTLLLTNYLQSAHDRKMIGTFGEVDADKVIEYARKMLRVRHVRNGSLS